MIAVEIRHHECVKLFLANGADVNAANTVCNLGDIAAILPQLFYLELRADSCGCGCGYG